MAELTSCPRIAQITRESDVNDDIILRWTCLDAGLDHIDFR